MSLSHCWGASSFLTLKSTNLSDFKEGKPLHVLSKVFKDAIFVTRSLGCNMIWIDSLCIIQDSLDDWRKESVNMSKVYVNAVCNIAATGSSGCDEGLFHNQESALIAPCIVQAISGKGVHSAWSVIDFGSWGSQVLRAPLNKRGWVLQERLLSRRILHFAKEQLFWECSEKTHCEAWSSSMASDITSFTSDADSTNKVFRSRQTHDEGSLQLAEKIEKNHAGVRDFHDAWMRVVRDYTQCKLTVPTDKLVALFGLIDIIRRESNDECLAGLWKSQLLTELLWHRRGSNEMFESFRPYDEGFKRHRFSRAPSWSWASLDGPIEHSDDEGPVTGEKPIATIIYAGMQDDLETPSAICSQGFIRLETYLGKGVYRERGFNSRLVFECLGGLSGTATFDTPVEEGDHPVFCASLLYFEGESSRGASGPGRYFAVRGLMLRAKDVEQSAYIRVGYFRVRYDANNIYDAQELFGYNLKVSDDLERTSESLEKQTITIV